MMFCATCLFGLESYLGEEIESLGYRKTETMDGRILFEGDRMAAAHMNLWSRFAERIYLHMGVFECHSFEDLFEGTASLEWESVIGKNDAFPVNGHAVKSDLFSVPDCQKIIKKSLATRLGKKYGLQILPETDTVYPIEFFLFKNRAHLMIDLSGEPLHKRGYRPQSVVAPLRETLAAAIVKCSRPRENVLLWDPLCGSGTIAIEASLMMTNRAPGLYRSFGCEKFSILTEKDWKEARESALSKMIAHTDFRCYASDIDPLCVEVARESAKRAGVENLIRSFVADARKIEKPQDVRGTIVTNPPYGERLMTLGEAEELYRSLGKAFRTLERWQMYILTSHEKFPVLFGRRADKVRKLYNGMIPCYLYQYFKNNTEKINPRQVVRT